MTIHEKIEAALQADARWFSDHLNRQYHMRAATAGDALQHANGDDVRWVVVPRPQDGLWTRYHGAGGLPDGASFTDADAEAWLASHPHARTVYAIADPVNLRLFQTGPDTAATTRP